MRVSDIVPHLPLAPASGRAPAASRSAETNPAAWFEASAGEQSARISADVSAASRGLSVGEHAARVLTHLVGDANADA